jgi:wyosine [tRNA(Phe)-imidazoG37] synthetase (radical SAM superfamily)
MKADSPHYVYGPVPSRRLGRSLGIDLVPFKICSYDCVYCQLGRTTNKTLERKEYVPISEVLDELRRKLKDGENPDYITLAGSGEPTLNSGLGDLIREIKTLTDIPLAVITNGSLLWMREVREALRAADLVIPSLDAGGESLFRRINRPHSGIAFDRMVEGLADFTAQFPGRIWLEVFLLSGLTGTPSEVRKIAALVQRIAPDRVQLNTVYRPPAEKYARPLNSGEMRALSVLFPDGADIIHEDEEDPPRAPAVRGASDSEILAILRRHPCTARDAAASLGIHPVEALKRLDGLMESGRVKTVVMENSVFYVVADSDEG